jgi:hypothetical protein
MIGQVDADAQTEENVFVEEVRAISGSAEESV